MATPASYPDPIPGVIPHGSIATFSGATGVGKTAMFAGWIRALQSGEPICGHPTNRPAAVGIIAGDRRWQSHRQWFEAAGCEPVRHYSLRDDVKFNWLSLRNYAACQTAFNRILDALDLPPGSFLGIDPFSIFLPGKVNDYKDVAIGLGMLDQILYPRQITTCGIFHQSKQIADKSQQYLRPQDKILGSAAQIGFSDTAIYLSTPQELDVDYYGLGWVPHHAPPETFCFKRDCFGLFVPYEPETADSPSTDAQVYDCVPADGSAVSAKVLIALAYSTHGVSRATVKRALSRLLDQGAIQQPARGRYARKPGHLKLIKFP